MRGAEPMRLRLLKEGIFRVCQGVQTLRVYQTPSPIRPLRSIFFSRSASSLLLASRTTRFRTRCLPLPQVRCPRIPLQFPPLSGNSELRIVFESLRQTTKARISDLEPPLQESSVRY